MSYRSHFEPELQRCGKFFLVTKAMNHRHIMCCLYCEHKISKGLGVHLLSHQGFLESLGRSPVWTRVICSPFLTLHSTQHYLHTMTTERGTDFLSWCVWWPANVTLHVHQRSTEATEKTFPGLGDLNELRTNETHNSGHGAMQSRHQQSPYLNPL